MTEQTIPGIPVNSTLTAKASADLQAQIKEELNVKDPTPEVAKATLDDKEEDPDENTDKDEPAGQGGSV